MPDQSRLTIALDPSVSARLDRLARREGKQAAEIDAALRESDAGDFATDAEVAAVFARWSAAPTR